MDTTIPLALTATALVVTAARLWFIARQATAQRAWAQECERLAAIRLNAVNHLTDRNASLDATNRRLSAELAAFLNRRDRQAAQCRANASKGGRAAAAKKRAERES